MHIRPALTAISICAWIHAGAASVLLAASDFASAQQLVTISRGEGASILPDGRSYRLGERPPARSPSEVILEGNPISRICCSAGAASCITERQVALNASRPDVLGRYGPPGSGSNSRELRYPGIAFTMSQSGRVERICVERR